ncbi:MAG TPA: hypothetical protein VK463_15220 [Desulfomonilaceae bacterium]|nr:hypothetical protein [Desulfomonilaceae bacterium]
MDTLTVLGMVLWAAAVAVIVGVLLGTAKAEDRRNMSAIRKPEGEGGFQLSRQDCYDLCMKDLLYDLRKRPVCMSACGL